MDQNLIGESAAILNSNFIAIAMVKDRHILWANAAMHRIYGYEPDELIGQPTRKLFLDQERYELFGRVAYSAIAEGAIVKSGVQGEIKRQSGLWFLVRCRP